MDIKITHEGVTVEVIGVPTTKTACSSTYDSTPFEDIESVIVKTITAALGGEKVTAPTKGGSDEKA